MAMTEVLSEAIGPRRGIGLRAKQAALVVAGIAAMAIAAKIRVPFWPVPATMQTFVVLTIGAAYGTRLSLATMLGYLAVGAFGFNIFTSSSAEVNGIAYMLGSTGGYLVGFAVAAGVMGALAARGWDRTWGRMALSMLIGTAIIYAFGLAWMSHLFLADKGMAWVVKYGFTNFVPFELVKVALAAVLFPVIWRGVGNARA